MAGGAPDRSRWVAIGLFLLAFGLAVNSLLGPLVFETIRYRYSESLINQGIGWYQPLWQRWLSRRSRGHSLPMKSHDPREGGDRGSARARTAAEDCAERYP